MDVLGIDNVLIPVGDLVLAKDFYSGVLGLSLVFEIAHRGIALFRMGDETPGVAVLTGDTRAGDLPSAASGGMRLWLRVSDARAAARELAGRGVEALAPPFELPTGWTVEIADPWGNVIGLTDHLKDPGQAWPA